MTTGPATFKKCERVSEKKLIDELFTKGKKKYISGFTFYKLVTENVAEAPVSVIIVAKKRIFRHAVDRNKVKRLIREAYRHNKFLLEDWQEIQKKRLILGMVYVGKNIPKYEDCCEVLKEYFTYINKSK